MNFTPAASLTFLFVSLLSAQDGNPAADPLHAAKSRLKSALEKTATIADTALESRWGEDRKKQGDADKIAVFFGARNKGEVKSSWHKGVMTYSFAGDEGDELITAGRRTIAKDKNQDWLLRSGRFADGNATSFLPDAELLLEQLASLDLAVVHRDVGSLDDRPVEILTVTLSADQVAALSFSGLIPSALTSPAMFTEIRIRAAGPNGARQAPTAPSATVDLAITLDPAAGLVHDLKFRSWTKANAQVAGQRVFVAAAGVQIGGVGGDEEEEEEEEVKDGADAAIRYEGGLPVRSRKKMTVMDYSIRLRDHGKTAPPTLTDAQKKLLRL